MGPHSDHHVWMADQIIALYSTTDFSAICSDLSDALHTFDWRELDPELAKRERIKLEESKTLYELYERLRVHEERDVGAWNSTMKTILTRTGYEFSVATKVIRRHPPTAYRAIYKDVCLLLQDDCDWSGYDISRQRDEQAYLEVAKFVYAMYADRQEGRDPRPVPMLRAQIAPPAYDFSDDAKVIKTKMALSAAPLLATAAVQGDKSVCATSNRGGWTIRRLMRRLSGRRGKTSRGCDCGHRGFAF